MTSVIAWMAVDNRQPTALYFASDSRRSFKDGHPPLDDCTKIFIAKGTQEMFAFSGDVAYAGLALRNLCTAIEAGGIPPNLRQSPCGRTEWVRDFLRNELESGKRVLEYFTTILYGTRHEWGVKASFTVNSFSIAANSDRVVWEELSSDLSNSAVVEINGTGTLSVKNFIFRTVKTVGPYSRAYFSAFCNSVMSDDDPGSGGPIQLAGLTCKGNAQHYGVVLPTGVFFRGLPYNGIPDVSYWRNDKLEVVMSNGILKKNAQRHGWTIAKGSE